MYHWLIYTMMNWVVLLSSIKWCCSTQHSHAWWSRCSQKKHIDSSTTVSRRDLGTRDLNFGEVGEQSAFPADEARMNEPRLLKFSDVVVSRHTESVTCDRAQPRRSLFLSVLPSPSTPSGLGK